MGLLCLGCFPWIIVFSLVSANGTHNGDEAPFCYTTGAHLMLGTSPLKLSSQPVEFHTVSPGAAKGTGLNKDNRHHTHDVESVVMNLRATFYHFKGPWAAV